MYFTFERTEDGFRISILSCLSQLETEEGQEFVKLSDIKQTCMQKGMQTFWIDEDHLNEGKLLIVKGNLVEPRKKQIVTEWSE